MRCSLAVRDVFEWKERLIPQTSNWSGTWKKNRSREKTRKIHFSSAFSSLIAFSGVKVQTKILCSRKRYFYNYYYFYNFCDCWSACFANQLINFENNNHLAFFYNSLCAQYLLMNKKQCWPMCVIRWVCSLMEHKFDYYFSGLRAFKPFYCNSFKLKMHFEISSHCK